MPHFVIEQGNALLTKEDRQDAMSIAGDIGANCGFIAATDIKLRVADYTEFVLIDGRKSFMHITVHLLEGRTKRQKVTLTSALREAFGERFPEVDSLSFSCMDLEPISYKKLLRD
jgi:5-carboxymethyl-2-hydroxymuconate isomerase